MKVKWTDEQLDAINSTDKGVIVPAAAGSGKTAVLIERITRLLSDEEKKIPADKLLAVTFTNDAAAQMREKLSIAMEKAVKQNPESEWLLSQQNLISLAKVSTINSFCLEFVKEHLDKFGFQSGLKILDENQDQVITYNSIKQALDNLCKNSPDEFRIICNNFGLKKDDLEGQGLYKVITTLYTFLRSLPFREEWIQKAVDNFSNSDSVNRIVKMKYQTALQNLKDIMQKYRKLSGLLNEARNCNEQERKNVHTFIDGFTNWLNKYTDKFINPFTKVIKAKDYDGIRTFKVEIDRVPGAPKNSKAKSNKEPATSSETLEKLAGIQAKLKDLNDKNKKTAQKIINDFAVDKNDIQGKMVDCGKIFTILCNVVEDAEKIAMEEKLELNSVSFSDVELMAKDLLVEKTEDSCKRTALAEEIRKSGDYRIILIDEFQDVNNLQELIFRTISDSDDLNLYGNNIFVVGDVKQAIYKFRLTNPELFTQCLEKADDPKNADKMKSIYLNKNFRSRKEVIDFTNFVFKNLMSVRAGSVTYDTKEMLVQGATYSERPSPVEVMMIKSNDNTTIRNKRGYSDENLVVAQKIKKMLDEKTPVFDGEKDRDCQASDFCVLVLTNSEVKKMSNALKAVGLSANTEDIEGYMESEEIVFVLNILRVIDNPMNDIALTGVLLSPIQSLGFTPDELAKIKVCDREQNKLIRHIYPILSSAKSDKKNADEKESKYLDLKDEKLQEKCRLAFNFIDNLRFYSCSMTLEKLIGKIYEITDLMGITSLYLDSEKKKANLHLLLKYAKEYEKNNNQGVSGFLRYIDAVAGKNAFQQAATITSAANCVNIKTFHKSKGLEYPFVFLCQLHNGFFVDHPSVYLDNNAGAGFKLADNSLHIDKVSPYFEYTKKVCEDDTKSEKMRLLYVGATRAKEKLFVSYATKIKDNSSFEQEIEKQRDVAESVLTDLIISPETVLSYDNMLSWITIALTKYPKNQKFMDFLGVDCTNIVTDSSGKNVDIVFEQYEITEISNEQNEEEKIQNKSETDEKLKKSLKEKFSFSYDKTESTQPSKLAVTEIVQNQNEKELKKPEFFPNLPRLDDELDKLSSAEKGTFTHKFMELANYENAEKSVKDELDRLVENGYLTQKEASGVYTESLENFFKSPFYERMKNSEEILREKKFLISMGDINPEGKLAELTGKDGMIQGIVDCIFKEDDGYVIVDYKTDKFDDINEMYKYSTQLALYKLAMETILQAKVKECYIYSLYLGQGSGFNF